MNQINEFKGTYSFLSNFYPYKMEYNGLTYLSSEAAYQAQKTDNRSVQETFQNLGPTDAKHLGRAVDMRSDWDEVKDQVMLDILRIKFSDQALKDKLLATGDAILIEGNTWHDAYWGMILVDGVPTEGKNMLGKMLMQVRDELRQ